MLQYRNILQKNLPLTEKGGSIERKFVVEYEIVQNEFPGEKLPSVKW